MYSTRSKKRLKKHPNKTSPLVGNATKRPEARTVKREGERGATEVIRGSSNVFEDLGFEPAEAANLRIRADLMLDLRRYVQQRGWTQAEAAEFFRETQPRISNLLRGEIARFSIDKLINMLARAGITVSVETKSRAA